MLFDQVSQRMEETRPFRVEGESAVLESAWMPGASGCNGGRSVKPQSPQAGGYLGVPLQDCWQCSYTHPPNILRFDDDWRVEEEQHTVRIGREWVARNGPPDAGNVRELFQALAPHNGEGAPRLRLIHNAYPAGYIGPLEVAESLVCLADRESHNVDCSQCSPLIRQALFDLYAMLAEYAESRGLTPVPIVNGGRQRVSGCSSGCPHGQIWLLRAKPELYEAIERRGDQLGYCPLCAEIGRPDLSVPVAGLSKLRVLAHPAPQRSWSLVIAPVECTATLRAEDSGEWAAAYAAAVGGLERRLGAMPAYNFFIRIGAGHVHAVVLPRNTNIPGSVEYATGLTTVDVKPADAAARVAAALVAMR
jgi:hypothetical protein